MANETLTSPAPALANEGSKNPSSGEPAPANPVPQHGAIAIAATFTAEPLSDVLSYWIHKLGLSTRIEFAPYNQVLRCLLDPSAGFASNKNGLNVVLVRIEDWERFRNGGGARIAHLQQQCEELRAAVRSAAATSPSPILVCLCPSSPAFAQDPELQDLFKSIENQLTGLSEIANVQFVSTASLLGLYPVSDYHDSTADKLGHIPFKPEMYSALATVIARSFHGRKRPPYKVIVLDCDNTLWNGICGEKGPQGVEIDPPRQALQNFMKSRKEQGALLCICSKNNPEDVDATFLAHPEMPLSSTDIVAWRVNWRPKSENIKSLAAELNLGLDSFIFVDDNPMETAEVQAACPGVVALTLPSSVSRIPQVLDHFWAFDQFGATAEDRKRTAMYQQNSQRSQLRSQSLSYADFLANLQVQIEIRELEPGEIARAAQMTQRTNQFNFTTKRQTEADIRKLLDAGDVKVLTAFVRDRFGDYGQVGLIVCKVAAQAVQVENFLLSCRVLSKGVEHAMIARLGLIARQHGLPLVEVPYIQSAKNAPARDFLLTLEAAFRNENEHGFVYCLPTEYAATFQFKAPAEEQIVQEEGKEQKKAKASDSSIPLADFEWIAANAGDVRLLLDAVAATASSSAAAEVLSPDLPRNKLETQLVGIWERVLRVSPIGIHSSFFDLGGDSIVAVRMFVELKHVCGEDLPLVTLFEAPTIAQLAEHLSNRKSKPQWECLVPIKSTGSWPAFYCVHGVGGNILEFIDLARYIHPEQPLYGIQAIGLSGRVPRQNLTVEEMTKQYIREIREFQPAGPYYIGGSSFGGLVAYEMARQLRAAGETVAMVALFDTHGPGYPQKLPARSAWQIRLDRLRYRATLHWGNFLSTEPRKRPEYVRLKAHRLISETTHQMRQKLKKAGRAVKSKWERLFWPEAIIEVSKAGRWAAGDYVPQPYDGGITLFRATEQPRGIYPERVLGWDKVVRGRIDVYDTPGHHGAIVRDPRAQKLAQQLDDALAKARQEWRDATRPEVAPEERALAQSANV